MSPEVSVDAASVIPRLFSAIVWCETDRAPLQDLLEGMQLIHPQAPLRWTSAADLHLSLYFYGDTPAAAAMRLVDDVATLALQAKASTLEFDRIQTWPTGQSRVVVACFRTSRVLRDLQGALERQARESGFAPETRRFRAHVTMARAGKAWDGGLAQLKLASFSLPAVQVALWHGALRPDTSRYAELARVALVNASPQA